MPHPKDKPKLIFGSRWEREKEEIDKLELDVHKEVLSRGAEEYLSLIDKGEPDSTKDDWSKKIEKLKKIDDERTSFLPSFSGSIKTKGLKVDVKQGKEGHLKASLDMNVEVLDKPTKIKLDLKS